MSDKKDEKTEKPSGLHLEGEGSYEGARKFQKEQHEFAEHGPVEEKAQEAADALDGPEGEELEKARKETGQKASTS